MPSDRILRYSVFGGIIIGATIGLPVLDFLNCCCCAGVILGGFLSVFFALQDQEAASIGITQSAALQLGVFSGLFGAIIGTILHVLVLWIVGDFFIEVVSSILSNEDFQDSLPPGVLDQIRDMIGTDEGLSAAEVVFHLFMWLILGPLFGLIGGFLGYAILQKRPPLTIPPQEVQ
jgi:hypothetical protein